MIPRSLRPEALRLRNALPLIALVVTLVAGCSKPPEGPIGTPVEHNGVEVTLRSATLTWIDLEGPTGAAQTQEPVLLLQLGVTNQGETPIRYDLNWSATQANQNTSALLFVDDGEDKSRPPRPDNVIPPVNLGQWQFLGEHINEATPIAPGESISDQLLFQRPPRGVSSLVLSLPPRIFGSDNRMPLYVTIPWSEPGEVPEPPSITVGETFENDEITFTLNGVAVEYVRLTSTTAGEGFSDTPLLRINYTARNASDRTLRYQPRSSATEAPRLADGEGNALSRATFGANIHPAGQIRDTRQLGNGESVSNFILFERPPQGTEALRLFIVGQRFGSTGLIRAQFPYRWEDPPLPPELAEDDGNGNGNGE